MNTAEVYLGTNIPRTCIHTLIQNEKSGKECFNRKMQLEIYGVESIATNFLQFSVDKFFEYNIIQRKIKLNFRYQS